MDRINHAKIEELRRGKSLSRRKLGLLIFDDHAGISTNALIQRVRAIETGVKKVDAPLLARIAGALDTHPNTFKFAKPGGLKAQIQHLIEGIDLADSLNDREMMITLLQKAIEILSEK